MAWPAFSRNGSSGPVIPDSQKFGLKAWGEKEEDFQFRIEREIEGGYQNQKERIDACRKQLEYSKADFERWPTPSKDARWNAGSARRTSPVMARVVQVLTANLYKSQPTRKLADPESTALLEAVYKACSMWSKWKRADELTLIGGFAAFQWQGTANPDEPIRCMLWGADEILFWLDPDDSTQCAAVATIDQYDSAERVRLYTREQVVTFERPKAVGHEGTSQRVLRQTARRDNPYRDALGEGILPFSFVHWYPPVQTFEFKGPGTNLCEINDHLNQRLDRLGDAIHFNGRPLGVAEGVDPTWVPPVEVKPGDFLTLPPANIDAAGNGIPPRLNFVQPNLQYVQMDWVDLNFYLDHELEMHGLPPVLIRMVQSGARSGLSILAEQAPLLTWVESRRPVWADYEDKAAHKCLEILAAHLALNGVPLAARVEAILADWQFTLRWPQLFVQLPGPERDREDTYRLKNGYISKVGILMERQGLTEEEAFEELGKVAAQNERLEQLGIDPNPPMGFGESGGGFTTQGEGEAAAEQEEAAAEEEA